VEKFSAENFYPVNIGDVIGSRYQMIGKLGCGRTSAVSLARDLRYVRSGSSMDQKQLMFPSDHCYVALKFYSRSGFTEHEFRIYQMLSASDQSHPGLGYVRTAIDIIGINREGGDHGCLVQWPM
jgi:hypothetical protein